CAKDREPIYYYGSDYYFHYGLDSW
nr:immunoglobulin heavy chain junction region [Macaca mulatta]MOW86891.1 immunoglobulin heavy chain junction region [Macaca mulatta]MOW88430.1 immunoglobulin heavy chain junction region [Macaca mulatta]MOW88576.1 immunoglobulin heavy chain junction region [Macaca mulatta]MOW88684.1 immunoglobulin heavy chain junction region [Macaca mulatta]